MHLSTLLMGAPLLAALGIPSLFLLDCYAGPDDQAAGQRVFISASGGEEQAADQPQETELEPEPAEPVDPLMLLGPLFAKPVLPLEQATLDLLNKRSHSKAAKAVAALDTSALSPEAQADHAFLLAWLRIRTGQAAQAIPLLEQVAAAPTPPAAYVALTLGEILLADGRALEAADKLQGISADDAVIWPRAQVMLGEALYKLERTADSRAVYQALSEREDPSEGTALALLTLARRYGIGSEEAYPLLRRIWREYPNSAEDSAARKNLAGYEARGSKYRASWRDKAARADALMGQRRYNDAVNLLTPVVGAIKEADADACRAWYALGRSHYRKNNLTKAHSILKPAGEKCAQADQDRGAKSFYLAGKAMERKKAWASAAQVYERLPVLYAEHSMADDGYVLAGIGWQEAGDTAKAMERWAAQVDAYPTGDMAGEGFWRLAWNAYLQGDTPSAIQWAERATEELPLEQDPVHVRAAGYWQIRWQLYPNREAPSQLVQDEQLREAAIERLLGFCRQHPGSYYGLLAAGRLQELAPERLAALPHPGWGAAPGAWQVRQSFLDSTVASNAFALARVGLLAEALAELNQLDRDELNPGEIGVFTDLMTANGQWLWAHDRLRTYVRSHPPESLTSNRSRLLISTWLRKYEAETKAACEPHDFDFRLFHGLVREESNFNKDIVSHAGARGLSQLMPATARSVGGWMGMSVSKATMFDVESNLKIGARYLAFLLKRYGGDPFLSLAGYNAGEGNVDKWLRQRGNRPVDEFVESIPYRETRNYVKRVSKSWQMYHLLYDGGTAFPDLKAYNHVASP